MCRIVIRMTSSQPFCICHNTCLSLQTIPLFLVKWSPHEVGVKADGKGVQCEGSQVLESHPIGLTHHHRLPVMRKLSRGARGDDFDWIREQFLNLPILLKIDATQSVSAISTRVLRALELHALIPQTPLGCIQLLHVHVYTNLGSHADCLQVQIQCCRSSCMSQSNCGSFVHIHHSARYIHQHLRVRMHKNYIHVLRIIGV